MRISGGQSYAEMITGYDDLYRPTSRRITIPSTETGLGGLYDYSYSYNPDGTPLTTTLPAVGGLGGETLHHHYNDLGQPIQLTSAYGGALTYVSDTAYNALGQVDQYTLDIDADTGDRVRLSYGRELETSRLTQLFVDLDAAPWVATDRRYTYDDAGTITKIADLTHSDTQCFEHDYLRRLVAAWTPASGDCESTPSTGGLGGPAPYWHSWTYDTVGNRLSQTVHQTGGDTTSTYSYPAAGSPRPHAVTSISTTGPGGSTLDTYGYDNAGNTTSRPAPAGGTQNLTWDAEGRLATTADSTGNTSYLYNGHGERLVSRDPAGKTLYLPGQEIRYNTGTGSSIATRYYTHNATLIASRTVTGVTWLANDHQGTAHIAIDQTTLAITQRRQTPFGTPRGTAPTWPNPHGFVDGINDPTGLTHLGARQYDPKIGRFISVDLIMDRSDPQQWNAYAYANNSPITFSDPDGKLLLAGDRAGDPPTPSFREREDGVRHKLVNFLYKTADNLRAAGAGLVATLVGAVNDLGTGLQRVKAGALSLVHRCIGTICTDRFHGASSGFIRWLPFGKSFLTFNKLSKMDNAHSINTLFRKNPTAKALSALTGLRYVSRGPEEQLRSWEQASPLWTK